MVNNLYEDFLDSIGVFKGDKIYVASDLRILINIFRKKGYSFETRQFIYCLTIRVGNEGSLVFPTFSWDFCDLGIYNHRLTRGSTGSLGNAALLRADFKRTKHPIYSFAVWGSHQSMITTLSNKGSFTSNSPFGIFHREGYKMIMIDVTHENSFTFIHYIERQLFVNYRYIKKFVGNYVSETGVESVESYYMFVRPRRYSSYKLSFKIGKLLYDTGVSKSSKWYQSNVEITDLASSFEVIKNYIIENQLQKLAAISNNDRSKNDRTCL